jgi:hypothetical protein
VLIVASVRYAKVAGRRSQRSLAKITHKDRSEGLYTQSVSMAAMPVSRAGSVFQESVIWCTNGSDDRRCLVVHDNNSSVGSNGLGGYESIVLCCSTICTKQRAKNHAKAWYSVRHYSATSQARKLIFSL